MGRQILDQFSLLHFATGVLAYFWGLSFAIWMTISIIFELIENTKVVGEFLNDAVSIWPGGKPEPDFWRNRFGDILTGAIGWATAAALDSHFVAATDEGRHRDADV